MPLTKSTWQVSFTSGVDTKEDSKQVLPTKLLALTNGVFQNPGQINKRNGYAPLATSILGGGAISNGVLLTTFNTELVEIDGTSLYSYSPSLADWSSRGALLNCAGSVSPVARSLNSFYNQDSAYHAASGLKCFVYMNAQSVTYSVIDSATGGQIVSGVVLGGPNYRGLKVLTLGNNFIVSSYFYNGTTSSLNYWAIPVSTPQTPGSPVSVTTNSIAALQYNNAVQASNAAWDAEAINGSIVYAWCPAANPNGIKVISLSSSLVLGTTFTYATGLAYFVICVTGDASGNVWLGYGDGATALNGLILAPNLASIVTGPNTLATLGSTDACINVSCVVQGTVGTYIFEHEIAFPDMNYTQIYGPNIDSATMTLAGSVNLFGPVSLANLGLASKPFVYSGQIYFLALYAGTYVPQPTTSFGFPLVTLKTIEPTLFLVNGLGVAVAKYAKENAGTYLRSGQLPETPSTSAANYFFAIQETDSYSTLNAKPSFIYGVSSATINFLPAMEPPSISLGNNLLVASGIVAMYDGKNVCEQNFHIYPENVFAQFSAPNGRIGKGASTATLNQFGYVTTYEWVDAQGQTHRSTPSIPVLIPLPTTSALTFTGNATLNSNVILGVSGATTAQLFVGQVVISAATLWPAGTTITSVGATSFSISSLANATAAGTSISTNDINVGGVTIPPLPLTQKNIKEVTAVVYRTQNNGTIYYKVGSVQASTTLAVSFVDTTPDSILIGNPQLYTTGEVEDSAPPQLSALVTFKSRAVGIPTENPYGIVYSKQVIPAPAGVGSEGSPVEFSSEFSQNCDSLGGPLRALGVIDDKLILFKSRTIFYMTGTGPAASGTQNDFSDPQLINANVGSVNPASVVSTPFGAMFQANGNGIWLMDRSLQVSYVGAEVEAYNGFTVTCARLVSTANQVRFALSNGTALVYDYYVKAWSVFTNISAVSATSYKGNFAYLTAAGVTNVEAPGVFTDNGAFVQLSLTTAWISLAKLQGFQRIWRAYVLGSYRSAHTLLVNVFTDFVSTAVQNVTIPVPTPPTTAYQWRIHMARQKCEAIQFQIQDSQSSSFGEGYAISGLTLDVGAEIAGGVKLPAAQSF